MITMITHTLTETPAWKEAADSSSRPRFPWKQYLGVSLRQYAYSKAEEGWKQSSVCSEVKTVLWARGVAVTPYLANCIKIGVSAGYTEYRSLKKVKTMEEKIENPHTSGGFDAETELIKWTDLGTGERKDAKYFKPETDKRYRIVFFHAEPFRDFRYKKEGQDKVRTTLQSVDGVVVKHPIWETGSYDIINTLKKVVTEARLSRTEFLLKRIEDKGKIRYVFEELGAPSPSSSDDVGALM